MKLGVTKIFCAVFIAFLIVALGSIARTQKPQGCNEPPWFNPGKNCKFKVKPYHYQAAGGIYINREQRRCKEVILICGTMMVRESVVNKDPGCGGAFWPDPKDGDEVCCEEFQKAVQSKQPCDPSKDADCDGLPNDTDPDPLSPRDPDADSKCKQLDYEVYVAYLKAGANENTAQGARRAANDDCNKRRANKRCGIPTPDPPNDPAIYFPDPDRDDKCKQLAFDVYQAYRKAGANPDTALGASETAKYDCLRRRASKM
ncbi:MAG: hypothetical protein M3Y84_07945 [Acidobacteriota bacterium]|nr:hypothetical protein [Acidobacteriota bacterium]